MTGSLSGLSCSSSSSFSLAATSVPQPADLNAPKRQRVTTAESVSQINPTRLITASYFVYAIETQIHQSKGFTQSTEALLKHSFKYGYGKEVIRSLAKTFAFGTKYFPQSSAIVARLFKVASESGVEVQNLSNHYRSNGFGTFEERLLKFKNASKERSYGDPVPFCKLYPNESESPVEALVRVLGIDQTMTGLTIDCYDRNDNDTRYKLTARDLPPVLTEINKHPTLTSVSFFGYCFEDQSAAVFSAFIPQMQLTELCFNTTADMTLDGVTQIMASMASNSTITSLKLTTYCDNIVEDDETDEYRRAVAGLKTAMEGFLKGNTTVVSLHMEEDAMCEIGDIMADLLPLTATLTTLKLPNSTMREYALVRLFQAVQGGSLTVLDISGNRFSDACYEGVGRLLTYNTSLTELYFNNGNYPRFPEVVISETSANSIAVGLSYNTTLKVLDLSRNKMPVSSKIELAKVLEFSNFTLKSLLLNERDILVRQVYNAFRKALTRNHVLTRISLGYLPEGADRNSELVHKPKMLAFQVRNILNVRLLEATLFGMLLPRLFEKE